MKIKSVKTVARGRAGPAQGSLKAGHGRGSGKRLAGAFGA